MLSGTLFYISLTQSSFSSHFERNIKKSTANLCKFKVWPVVPSCVMSCVNLTVWKQFKNKLYETWTAHGKKSGISCKVASFN